MDFASFFSFLFLFLSQSCFLGNGSRVVGNDLSLSSFLTEDNEIEEDDSEERKESGKTQYRAMGHHGLHNGEK